MYEQNYQCDPAMMEEGMRKHALRAFLWMGLGLLATAISAAFFYYTGLSLYILYEFEFYSMILVVLLQFGVVIAFTSGLHKRSVTTTKVLFLAYSLITGFTVSILGWAYDAYSIMIAFGVTAVYFGSLCVIGYTTRMNLLKLGPLLIVSLLVLIAVEVVMMLFGFSIDTTLISGIGLLIFTLLTAFDVQKMKALYLGCQDEDMTHRLAIYSAFELYLDFINIFLYILRLLGNSRN